MKQGLLIQKWPNSHFFSCQTCSNTLTSVMLMLTLFHSAKGLLFWWWPATIHLNVNNHTSQIALQAGHNVTNFQHKFLLQEDMNEFCCVASLTQMSGLSCSIVVICCLSRNSSEMKKHIVVQFGLKGAQGHKPLCSGLVFFTLDTGVTQLNFIVTHNHQTRPRNKKRNKCLKCHNLHDHAQLL